MRFRTTFRLTLLLFLLAALFARLGYWQLQRMQEKERLFGSFESAPSMTLADAIEAGARFARVRAYGHFDPERHLLLDNRMHRGQPGVHVLTPFHASDGRVVLVNRGWLPLPPDRRSLPDVPTGEAAREISGRLNLLASQGPRLGEADRLRADRWPQLVTYLDREPAESALGVALAPWVVQLDADQPDGFAARDWQPSTMAPATHGAYALQWFSLAAAALVIWLLLGFHRSRTADDDRQTPVGES